MKKIKKTDIALIIGVIAIVVISFFAIQGNAPKIEKPVTVTGEGGLTQITYSEYEELINSEEPFIVVLSSATCSHCQNFMPVVESVSKEHNIPVKYVDLNEFSDENMSSLSESNSYLKRNQWGTPTTLVLVGENVVDSLEGETDEETLLEFLEENIVVEE